MIIPKNLVFVGYIGTGVVSLETKYTHAVYFKVNPILTITFPTKDRESVIEDTMYCNDPRGYVPHVVFQLGYRYWDCGWGVFLSQFTILKIRYFVELFTQKCIH